MFELLIALSFGVWDGLLPHWLSLGRNGLSLGILGPLISLLREEVELIFCVPEELTHFGCGEVEFLVCVHSILIELTLPKVRGWAVRIIIFIKTRGVLMP